METQQQEPMAEGVQDDSRGGLSDEEIRWWAYDGSVAKRIAADLAARIKSGKLNRWDELPDSGTLAKKWETSLRTVSRAKRLLAGRGMARKQANRYYVA